MSRLVEEQPAPNADPSLPDVWLLVMADVRKYHVGATELLETMEDRRLQGVEKYGTPVRPFNGRDALIDALQEILDACVYLRQKVEEYARSGDPVPVQVHAAYHSALVSAKMLRYFIEQRREHPRNG